MSEDVHHLPRPPHLDGCKVTTWREFSEQMDTPLPEGLDGPQADEGGIVQCAEGCPVRERDIARGRELAEQFGW